LGGEGEEREGIKKKKKDLPEHDSMPITSPFKAPLKEGGTKETTSGKGGKRSKGIEKKKGNTVTRALLRLSKVKVYSKEI